MTGSTLSLRSSGLRHKLFIVYGLMFILPVMFLLFIIAMLFLQQQQPTSTDVSSVRLSLLVGIGGVLAMSVCALMIMYRSIRSLEHVTKHAESFIQEVDGDRFTLAHSGDETEKISHYVTEMTAQLRNSITNADRYVRQLDEANRKLAHLALRDGLTCLYNQTYIKERLSTELARAQKFNHCLGILMLDVDDFKGYNDTYGHLRGDEALREIAHLIAENIRPIDVPSRYGGEEFLIILPETDLGEVIGIGEHIRQAVAGHSFRTKKPGDSTRLTISLGVGVYREGPTTLEQFISEADMSLYRAKGLGKNGVQWNCGGLIADGGDSEAESDVRLVEILDSRD